MHCSTVTSRRLSKAMSSAWPAIMAAVASAKAAEAAAPRPNGGFEQHLVGQDLQGVAGDDGRADPVHGPHRRAVMALGVGVDDVVVDEREVVDQLHGHGARYADLGVRPGRLGGEDGEGGPDALAARRARPDGRRGRSSPCGSWPGARISGASRSMASVRAGATARRERARTSGTPMVGVTPPPRCRLAAGNG